MSIRNAQIARYNEYQIGVSRGFAIRTEQAYIDGVLQQFLVTTDSNQNFGYSTAFNPWVVGTLPLGAFYNNINDINNISSPDNFTFLFFEINSNNVLAPYTNFYRPEAPVVNNSSWFINSNMEQYKQNNRKTYNPKIIPFQAQGNTVGNGNYASSQQRDTVTYLNITLPYPQATILRGQITNQYNSGNNNFDWFSEKIQIAYPEYSAIEILGLATNSRNQDPPGIAFENLGGEWLKKVLLFTWRAKSYIEEPFPSAFPNQTTSVGYWIPEGILPSTISPSIPLDPSWESYAKYTYGSYGFTGGGYESLFGSPFAQPTTDESVFNSYGLINPYEIILDDDAKTFTLNLKVHFVQRAFSNPNPNLSGCRFKGIAKLI